MNEQERNRIVGSFALLGGASVVVAAFVRSTALGFVALGLMLVGFAFLVAIGGSNR